MTICKEEALDMVRQLPDEIDMEGLIYRLYLREKIERGEADITARRTFSAEEIEAQAAERGE